MQPRSGHHAGLTEPQDTMEFLWVQKTDAKRAKTDAKTGKTDAKKGHRLLSNEVKGLLSPCNWKVHLQLFLNWQNFYSKELLTK